MFLVSLIIEEYTPLCEVNSGGHDYRRKSTFGWTWRKFFFGISTKSKRTGVLEGTVTLISYQEARWGTHGTHGTQRRSLWRLGYGLFPDLVSWCAGGSRGQTLVEKEQKKKKTRTLRKSKGLTSFRFWPARLGYLTRRFARVIGTSCRWKPKAKKRKLRVVDLGVGPLMGQAPFDQKVATHKCMLGGLFFGGWYWLALKNVREWTPDMLGSTVRLLNHIVDQPKARLILFSASMYNTCALVIDPPINLLGVINVQAYIGHTGKKKNLH